MDRTLFRIIDANFNRSREGLRVCEDICRFIMTNPKPAADLRSVRHSITKILKTLPRDQFVAARDVKGDFGRRAKHDRNRRTDWKDVYFANLQRSKESLRVLEETMKISFPNQSIEFKKMRFKLYDHEKKIHNRF